MRLSVVLGVRSAWRGPFFFATATSTLYLSHEYRSISRASLRGAEPPLLPPSVFTPFPWFLGCRIWNVADVRHAPFTRAPLHVPPKSGCDRRTYFCTTSPRRPQRIVFLLLLHPPFSSTRQQCALRSRDGWSGRQRFDDVAATGASDGRNGRLLGGELRRWRWRRW